MASEGLNLRSASSLRRGSSRCNCVILASCGDGVAAAGDALVVVLLGNIEWFSSRSKSVIDDGSTTGCGDIGGVRGKGSGKGPSE